ncbi:MAG: putative sensor histidine kinase TcrY [Herbaspirillum frisingense]|uniref:histidine kinase n=1 Tax=Herbaspirillum frisingense TaxID=92645 RepID=A0A7V8JTQ7_9BURK|nr:MAG: putative sensor histidine kinase TcrY [Herbaspirillum frisingense]
MSGLINDILDFARGRLGGGISASIIPQLNFWRQLEDVISELQMAHPMNPILRQIPHDLEVVCDGDRICQALSNLLKNALIHGEPEQPVTIRASVADKKFLLQVENFGPPIRKETQRRIFGPFARVPGKSSHEGLGLGLFIVAEIAKAHGGTVSVHSDEQSTIFSMELPQPRGEYRRVPSGTFLRRKDQIPYSLSYAGKMLLRSIKDVAPERRFCESFFFPALHLYQ